MSNPDKSAGTREDAGPVRLRLYPDPLLRKRCRCYGEDELDAARRTARRMLEVMYLRRGIGLAGTQAGVARRIFVLDVSEQKDSPLVLINPRVVSTDGGIVEADEGCLSFPGLYAPVARQRFAAVEYVGEDGERHSIEGEGLLARVLQHEADHLDGILFVDRIGPSWRSKIRPALKELEQAAKGGQPLANGRPTAGR